jgi:pyruvate kinase
MVVPTVGLEPFVSRLRQGDRVLVSDGDTELRVMQVLPQGVLVECPQQEALLTPRRSINLPDTEIEFRSLSPYDIGILSALEASGQQPEWIALSMVEGPEPLQQVRQLLPGCGVIAKIETRRGVENIAAIASHADAVMLARGDLSLNAGIDALPAVVTSVLSRAGLPAADFIVATGLVAGVAQSGRPSISDVMDLWWHYERGISSFVLSGFDPARYGRGAVTALRHLVDTFRMYELAVMREGAEGGADE